MLGSARDHDGVPNVPISTTPGRSGTAENTVAGWSLTVHKRQSGLHSWQICWCNSAMSLSQRSANMSVVSCSLRLAST
jgi:hypothetical protein